MHEIYCIVSGKVQGVAYRSYAQDAATVRGLVGWVRNRTDGTVELLAQGTTDELKEFIEALNEGSLGASVAGVAVEWRTTRQPLEDFTIRHD